MNSSSTQPKQTTLLITAWVFLLLASQLPRIILQELFNYQVSNNLVFGVPAMVILIGLILTFLWDAIQALRPFFILFLVLIGIEWLVFAQIAMSPRLETSSFNAAMLINQSLRLIVTLAVIAVLFILKKRREAFFLVKGDTSAPLEPVRWLGIKEGETWNKAGPIFAIALSLGTLTFLVLASRLSLNRLAGVLPFVPVVLLIATLNAFNEEMTYKASFLSVLENVVGKHQALWLMAAYFGIGHFYGIPYGVVGVLMAGFLGWLLGKSMLETRGLWWAWFLHFLQDVMIFAFLAIGSVAPGGG
jgi:membrane protease YdiL (CAAX protease family)